MQVTETSAEGLKRQYTITVEADVIDNKLDEKLKQLAGRIRLPGFRPGKVPVGHLRKLHGDALMGEVLEETVNDTTREALEKNELRPAMRPNIEITSFERGSALEYKLSVEVLPEIVPGDLSKVKLEKQTTPVGDGDIEEALKRIAEGQKAYKAAAKTYKAKKDDAVVIDFVGKRDGEPFEGGTAEDYELVLGSNSLIDLVVFGRAAAIRAGEIVNPKEAVSPVKKAEGGRVVVGCFQSADGKRYIFPVNRTLRYVVTSKLTLDEWAESVSEVSQETGELLPPTPLTDGTLELKLQPGDGQLFLINDKKS